MKLSNETNCSRKRKTPGEEPRVYFMSYETRAAAQFARYFARIIRIVDNNGDAVAPQGKRTTDTRSLNSANIVQFISRTCHILFAQY